MPKIYLKSGNKPCLPFTNKVKAIKCANKATKNGHKVQIRKYNNIYMVVRTKKAR
jgi:hypothetical protein